MKNLLYLLRVKLSHMKSSLLRQNLGINEMTIPPIFYLLFYNILPIFGNHAEKKEGAKSKGLACKGMVEV